MAPKVRSPATCHCTGAVKSMASPLKASEWCGDGGWSEQKVRSGYNTAGTVSTAPKGNQKVILFCFFSSLSPPIFLVMITCSGSEKLLHSLIALPFSFSLHTLKLNLGNCQSSKSQSSHDDIKPHRTKWFISSRRTAGGNKRGKKSQRCRRKKKKKDVTVIGTSWKYTLKWKHPSIISPPAVALTSLSTFFFPVLSKQRYLQSNSTPVIVIPFLIPCI